MDYSNFTLVLGMQFERIAEILEEHSCQYNVLQEPRPNANYFKASILELEFLKDDPGDWPNLRKLLGEPFQVRTGTRKVPGGSIYLAYHSVNPGVNFSEALAGVSGRIRIKNGHLVERVQLLYPGSQDSFKLR